MKFFLLILLVSFISAKRLLNTRHRAAQVTQQQTIDAHKQAVSDFFSIAWMNVWTCDSAAIKNEQRTLVTRLQKLRDATKTSDCTGAINEVTNWWNTAYAANHPTWLSYMCLGYFGP